MDIELKELLSEFSNNLKFDYDLKKKNWFNIGGKTKLYFKADNLKELIKFLKKIQNKEKIFILGGGSNTLITDEKFDGIVIKLTSNFNNISMLSEEIIIAGSAVTDKSLSEFAMENSLSGFEFLSCIPGTIGGGIKMNAGCFDREFKDILISVQAIDKSGQVLTIPVKDINFKYRDSGLSEDLIFLSASFKGFKKDKYLIKDKMKLLKDKKELAQPTRIKTSGSTFKNPKNYFAAELIEKAGCKGLNVGDAFVSNKHANFIINSNKASATHIEELGKRIIDRVYKKFKINLEWEIKIIGK